MRLSVLDCVSEILQAPAFQQYNQMFWIDLVGALASIAGFFLSLYVLRVAKGARKAAEEARSWARKRDLAQELGDVSHKLQQLGSLLQQEQWVAVGIRTDEVLASCREAMSRWSDHLSEDRKNGILQAISLIQTIATESVEMAQRELLPAERKKLTSTYLKASGHINAALGEARRAEERDGSDNGN